MEMICKAELDNGGIQCFPKENQRILVSLILQLIAYNPLQMGKLYNQTIS